MALPAGEAHWTLDHFTGEYGFDVAFQLRVVDAAGNVGQRAAAVAGDETEQLGHCRRKVADHEIPVEEYGRDLGALEQIGQVAVRAVQLIDLAPELAIDGLQLLVDRLQLLLRGFELFIGGLQLLVDRKQLFIGRSELLVGRLELLDRRLQSLLGLVQLPFDLPDGDVLAFWGFRVGVFMLRLDRTAIDEHDAVSRLVALFDRLDHEADRLDAAIDLHCNPTTGHASIRLLGLVQQCPQIRAQSRARHGNDVAVRGAGCSLQIFSGAGGEIKRLAGFVDDHIGRRKLLDDGVGHPAHQVGAARPLTIAHHRAGNDSTRVRQEMPDRHRGSRDQIAASEDTVRLVELKKQVRVSCNILRKPEEEIPAGP